MNVNHMELVTREENFRRAVAARTHCPSGHEYAVLGMYPMKNGRRRCRACSLINQRSYEKRKRERKA